jgi:hypothetical protein
MDWIPAFAGMTGIRGRLIKRRFIHAHRFFVISLINGNRRRPFLEIPAVPLPRHSRESGNLASILRREASHFNGSAGVLPEK